MELVEMVLTALPKQEELGIQAAEHLAHWRETGRPQDFFIQHKQSPGVVDTAFSTLIQNDHPRDASAAFECMGPNYITVERLAYGLRHGRRVSRVLLAYGARVLPLLWAAPKLMPTSSQCKDVIRRLNHVELSELVFLAVDNYHNAISSGEPRRMARAWDDLKAFPFILGQLGDLPAAYNSANPRVQARQLMQFVYQARRTVDAEVNERMLNSASLMNPATIHALKQIYGI